MTLLAPPIVRHATRRLVADVPKPVDHGATTGNRPVHQMISLLSFSVPDDRRETSWEWDEVDLHLFRGGAT